MRPFAEASLAKFALSGLLLLALLHSFAPAGANGSVSSAAGGCEISVCIVLTVTGPKRVVAGKPLTLHFKVRNESRAAVNGGQLRLLLDKGAVLLGGSAPHQVKAAGHGQHYVIWPLRKLGPERAVVVRARIRPEPGSPKAAKVYCPQAFVLVKGGMLASAAQEPCPPYRGA
jgi:hypothetical protein